MSDGIVAFDYQAWAAMFPELSVWVAQPAAQSYFDDAGLFLDNTAFSPIVDTARRARVLNWITAHLASMFSSLNGQPPRGLVGRISNATEGSVSVATTLDGMGKNEAWWAQTPYGLTAWQMLAPYRTGRYIAPPQVPLAAQSWPGGQATWPWPFAGFPTWPR